MPTYNEALTLKAVASAVAEHGYRLLIVDDHSPDGTGEIADSMAGSDDHVGVLHRPGKKGLGTAYVEGFARAIDEGASVVCEMDADLSHDPRQLPGLVRAVVDGADLAIGSRFVPGGAILNWPRRRRLLSRSGNLYARFMLGTPIRDMTSGFRAYRVAALQRINPRTCQSDGYAFQVETAWRAHRTGLRIVEVPITFTERRLGESKLDGKIVAEAMWLVTRWGIKRVFSRLRRHDVYGDADQSGHLGGGGKT